MDTESFYEKLGALIRERRKAMNLTQERLSDMVGLSRASVANIESGNQSVLLHHLYMIARALNVDPESLLPKEINKEDAKELKSRLPKQKASEDTVVWVKDIMKKAMND